MVVRQMSFGILRIFTVISWLRPAGVPASGRLVSHTRRPGIRSALPTVQAFGPYSRRSRHDTPIHSISNAESVPERRFPPAFRVRRFDALVWLRRSARVRGLSCWDEGSISSRDSCLISRPGRSPPNGFFKRDINQFHGQHRRFRTTFSFKSG